MVQEHIASQLVMSGIDDDVRVVNDTNKQPTQLLSQQRRDSETSTGSTSGDHDQSAKNASDKTTSSRSVDARKFNLSKLLRKVYDHMEQLRYRMQRETFKQCVNNEWLLVGTLVDKILFFTYCSIVIFCTLTIFSKS